MGSTARHWHGEHGKMYHTVISKGHAGAETKGNADEVPHKLIPLLTSAQGHSPARADGTARGLKGGAG